MQAAIRLWKIRFETVIDLWNNVMQSLVIKTYGHGNLLHNSNCMIMAKSKQQFCILRVTCILCAFSHQIAQKSAVMFLRRILCVRTDIPCCITLSLFHSKFYNCTMRELETFWHVGPIQFHQETIEKNSLLGYIKLVTWLRELLLILTFFRQWRMLLESSL